MNQSCKYVCLKKLSIIQIIQEKKYNVLYKSILEDILTDKVRNHIKYKEVFLSYQKYLIKSLFKSFHFILFIRNIEV